ncbi:MAG: glycosyltransferase family 2 protein [Tepidisphaeraceae bacterium]
MRLLMAIPIFNEIKYVRTVLDKVRGFHDEILFVDDGSTDGTGALLRGMSGIQLLRHESNLGYGQSIIDAFDFAAERGYHWVITMDCDEQHEPEMIPAFIEQVHADRWDMISGSRYLEARADDDLPPGDRRAINATITSLINGIYHLGITDAFCGFKAHRVSAMMPLRLDEPGYALPLQLWPRAARAGLRICEVPVRLIYNDPNRHFGGILDDAGNRMRHYLDVFNAELRRENVPADEPAQWPCGCL